MSVVISSMYICKVIVAAVLVADYSCCTAGIRKLRRPACPRTRSRAAQFGIHTRNRCRRQRHPRPAVLICLRGRGVESKMAGAMLSGPLVNCLSRRPVHIVYLSPRHPPRRPTFRVAVWGMDPLERQQQLPRVYSPQMYARYAAVRAQEVTAPPSFDGFVG